uniref:Uncharacterized protein n=1 Tax=Arundo donax TaxID=35708 RepID=A0A0A9FPX0_ARUDO
MVDTHVSLLALPKRSIGRKEYSYLTAMQFRRTSYNHLKEFHRLLEVVKK